MRCCLCAVLFFAAALTGVQAAPASEFPFEFREGLLWIEVNVPQSKATLNFLVDTGAGVSVINLSTAKRIGLKFGRKVMVQGVETVLTGYWVGGFGQIEQFVRTARGRTCGGGFLSRPSGAD